MKLKAYITIALCLVGAALGGCRDRQVTRQLEAAEALMDERPDSALALLRDIDSTRLSGEPQARYALLTSQALDKNYIDVTDDSLITIATNYYDFASDPYRRMLAHHYHSKVLFNAGYYELALEDALQALDIALSCENDHLNLSRISSHIAHLFVMTRSDAETLEWELIALHHAKIINKKEWMYNGYTSIANALNSMDRSEEALAYADSAAAIAGDMDQYVCKARYISYFGLFEYAKADSIFALMRNMEMPLTLQYLCIQEEIDRKLGRRPEGARFNSANLPEPTNAIERQIINFTLAGDRIDNRDYAGALEAFNEIIAGNNDMVLELSAHKHLLKIQANYANRKVVALKQQVRMQRLIMTLSIALIITVVALLAIIVYNIIGRHRRSMLSKEQQLVELTEEYERLREVAAGSQDTISTLSGNLSNLSSELVNLRRRSALAFAQRFAWVQKLGRILTETPDDSNEAKLRRKEYQDRISRSLSKTELKSFADEIETELANHDTTLLDEIKSYGLIDSEREVLIYLLASFSPRTVALLTQKSSRAIYNLKARIKNKLIGKTLSEEIRAALYVG